MNGRYMLQKLDSGLNRAAALITVAGFLFTLDVNFFDHVVFPSKPAIGSPGAKLVLFFVLESVFAYFFARIWVMAAFASISSKEKAAKVIAALIATLISAWQTVTLLFWFFPPEAGAERFGYSIVPILFNFIVIAFHVEEREGYSEYERTSGGLGLIFAYLLCYTFQAAVWT
ncbi:MAG: hypothetical protein KJ947_02445 [Alphaproteobacteria bacterium]|jgi:hypothetical protein|nr:hypothetical protein [Alphaproteobacteria bacterium]MBU1548421.1 hypothetical protein [Alphaproteobacteria bacterium]MBU2335817.1 hypothetical protein [Alphaproteobacteria bacterium]MBU2390788.1 hypothetical protein [Alphaproteobacteria bacterium]|tara:strand:+ start:205 stop:720 length:516 start_codon:yes stop_codon:yes gene_type:complete